MLKESSLFIMLLDFQKKNKIFGTKKSVNEKVDYNMKSQGISHFLDKTSLDENIARD